MISELVVHLGLQQMQVTNLYLPMTSSVQRRLPSTPPPPAVRRSWRRLRQSAILKCARVSENVDYEGEGTIFSIYSNAPLPPKKKKEEVRVIPFSL